MKQFIIGLIIIIFLGAAGYYLYTQGTFNTGASAQPSAATNATPIPAPPATSTPPTPENNETTSIGTSVEGRNITAYHYGNGDKEVVFVGGIHGGYEWNTAVVAFELIDYLKANPTAIPANLKVTVIPIVNPDGLYKVTGKTDRFLPADVNASKDIQVSGRFNANTVDLNRNFDCDWQANGIWQTKKVSGGNSAFSEPESQAIKSYIEASSPAAVVVWYSAAGGVYSSNCHGGVLPETKTLTETFAKASGYPPHEVFDYYVVTGDMVNWLAKMKIPAISVLLTNHTDTEWDKNQAGVNAVLQQIAK